MFRSKTIQGLMRLIAAVTLSVILLPFILQFYLAFSQEDSPQMLLNKLAAAIPFGDGILKVVTGVLTDAMSNQDSLLDWIGKQEYDVSHYFTMEMGKMVLSGVILAALTNLARARIADDKRRGMLNHAADLVALTLFVLTASLLSDLLFEFFHSLVMNTADSFRSVFMYIYSGGLGIAGIAIMVISGTMLADALLSVALSCFKMAWTYAGIMWMLLCPIYGCPDWLMILGVVTWAVFVLFFQCIEDMMKK